MKIIYLHQYFNTPAMSGGTRSYEMARRLASNGHEVHIVTSWREKDGRSQWFETEEDGIHVHWLPIPYSNHMSYRERILAFLQFALGSAKKARNLHGDVVFATSTPLTIALPAIYAAKRNKSPMVFEVRDLWPELPIAMGVLKNPVAKWMARRLEKYAYRNADHVVALSPGMKEGVIDCGYPEKNITVIPNSADLDVFHPRLKLRQDFRAIIPEIGSRKLLIYAGTFGAINGVGYLVEIAQAALHCGDKVYFLAIGDGAEKVKVESQAERLGVLGRNFRTLPPMPKKDIPLAFAAADVVCSLFINIKSMWANSANKFFDGLSSGTPLAINYSGWQADLLKETGAGIQLPADDARLAAQYLTEFLSNCELAEKAGEAARRLAETEFSRDKLARKLEGVLISVVERKHVNIS